MQTKSGCRVPRFIICVCGHDTNDRDCYVTSPSIWAGHDTGSYLGLWQLWWTVTTALCLPPATRRRHYSHNGQTIKHLIWNSVAESWILSETYCHRICSCVTLSLSAGILKPAAVSAVCSKCDGEDSEPVYQGQIVFILLYIFTQIFSMLQVFWRWRASQALLSPLPKLIIWR